MVLLCLSNSCFLTPFISLGESVELQENNLIDLWMTVWASLVAQKNLPAMRETWVWSLVEKETATDSSVLAGRIPYTLQITKSQTLLSGFRFHCVIWYKLSVRLRILFHEPNVKRLISFSSCALCYVCAQYEYPQTSWIHQIATSITRKTCNVSKNTNRLSCIIGPFSEDKDQPLVLIKTGVCVNPRTFTIGNHQKQWVEDDDTHKSANISPVYWG